MGQYSVALDTPFRPESTSRALIDFSFFKIHRQSKAAIINMLENFFDSNNMEYKLHIPELVEVQNKVEDTKLFIERDFPYKERKFPIIVVSIDSAKEKKMYMGVDNYVAHKVIEVKGKKTAIPIYTGAGNVTLKLIIATNSAEDRSKLAEMIGICFTHFYRWQYFYTLGDGNTFSIVPNTGELDFGGESEIEDDSANMTFIYTTNITMQAFIEYTFSGVSGGAEILGDVEIDGTSGVLPYE